MKRTPISSIERLESRTFLSATLVPEAAAHASPGAIVVTPPTVTGPTLHTVAGTPFSGSVGFYATPVLDPPLGYRATINWGDGITSNATLTYGSNGKTFGIVINGVHTYAKPGGYTVKVTLVTAPISPRSTLPTTVVEYIVDKAIAIPFPPNTSNGVTIAEVAGKAFTADLGAFTFIAPGTELSASINWGDGHVSHGIITATGVVGIDVIKFKVTGSHTYKLPGKYAIHIVVTRVSPAAGTAPFTVATIESTAKVLAPPVAVG